MLWRGVTCAGGKRHNEGGDFPTELSRLKKLQIDVQGNKLSNVEEYMCKMKNWNGRLVGTCGCDAIFCPWNTFSAEGRRKNVGEDCQPCPDGKIPKHLVPDQCEPNAASDNL